MWSQLDRDQPKLADLGRALATFTPKMPPSTKSGQAWPQVGQVWPPLAKPGPYRSELPESRPNLNSRSNVREITGQLWGDQIRSSNFPGCWARNVSATTERNMLQAKVLPNRKARATADKEPKQIEAMSNEGYASGRARHCPRILAQRRKMPCS